MPIYEDLVKHNAKDKRGISFGLIVAKDFPDPIVDIVLQTVQKGIRRGGHYHPKNSGKIEVFVPLEGEAEIKWHDRANPQDNSSIVMRPFNENEKLLRVYRVEPETCHVVSAQSDRFLMLALNNVPYAGKDPDCPCPKEYSLKLEDSEPDLETRVKNLEADTQRIKTHLKLGT